MPPGFVLDLENAPSPDALNKLLSRCNEATYPSSRLALALKKSTFHLSILDMPSRTLVGFVRATSDHGLNANLWNLVAQPGEYQSQFIAIFFFIAILVYELYLSSNGKNSMLLLDMQMKKLKLDLACKKLYLAQHECFVHFLGLTLLI